MEKFPTCYDNLMSGGKRDSSYVCDTSIYPTLPDVVTDVENIDRIISVSDIHGDLNLAIKLLEIPKLIERVYKLDDLTVKMWYKNEDTQRYYKWIGTRTIVVQVGDQVDRCRPYKGNCLIPEMTIDDESSDLTIMFFYQDLHIVALKADCAVYSLLGNHEILNVLGNMDYVSYKGLKEFPTNRHNKDIKSGRINAFKHNSTELYYKKKSTLPEFLGCGRQTSMIIDGYLFIHAGIMEKLISFVKKKSTEIVPTINKAVREWLLTSYLPKDQDFINTIILGKEESPFWPRIFGTIKKNKDLKSNECQTYVAPILKALSLKGIVVGHTPQLVTNINSTCSNTVWRVDVASSQAFDEVLFVGKKNANKRKKIQKGRKPQVLEIILGKQNIKDKFNILF